MTRPTTNIGASVRERLLNLARQRKTDFQLTLQRYAVERFVYRLGVSPHRNRFVLKGAMLFVLWDDTILRPTRDLDLAGYWANDAESLEATFREICLVPYPGDGIEFAMETLAITPIRETLEYHGFRLRIDVRLAGAVIPLQVDVGFGDAIVPEPLDVNYPVLLDAAAPWIRAYPREAVLAEKLHAMVIHGEANSRFKDFFDVWVLSSRFSFAGATVAAAIRATFSRRDSTSFTPWPVALSPAFYSDSRRSDSWARYLQRSRLIDAPPEFDKVGERVIGFLGPAFRAAASASGFESTWGAGGPWA
jgi:hypothetical protein